jgi:uncharacterized protein (TIGR04255 family)
MNISEFIFEIRFKPNPILLDFRGAWVSAISSRYKLDEWRVDNNRIDIFDRETSKRFFLSFNNFGLVVKDLDYDGIRPYIESYLALLNKHETINLPDPLSVKRVGIRGRKFIEIDDNYQKIVELFYTKYVNLNPSLLDVIKYDIDDMNIPINFAFPSGKINTNVGPMSLDQVAKFFEGKTSSNPGYFFDIDVFSTPDDEISMNEIKKTTLDFLSVNEEIFQKLSSYLQE